MSAIKTYPIYYACHAGQRCGHQHRRLEAAANCACQDGTVFRLDELGSHPHEQAASERRDQ
jgi:hypothetical protein